MSVIPPPYLRTEERGLVVEGLAVVRHKRAWDVDGALVDERRRTAVLGLRLGLGLGLELGLGYGLFGRNGGGRGGPREETGKGHKEKAPIIVKQIDI